MTYQVIQELNHHQSDVKAILSLDDGARLACASRDGSISLWARQADDIESPFVFESDFRGHDAYVNSLAHVVPDADKMQGWLASGGNSTMILLHPLDKLDSEATICLLGHTHNVCALHYSQPQKLLASASWDTTARIWMRRGNDWACQLVLEGHRQAVWDVTIVDDTPWQGCYITASADGEIWIWNSQGQAVRRLKCCPEPVRSLALLSTGELASASNDAVIRIWDGQGRTIASLHGHDAYIYHVSATANGLMSSGEDQTTSLWNNSGVQAAVLKHPCTSVWSAADFNDGLVVTGGSDGVIRVWRLAPEALHEETALAKVEGVTGDSQNTEALSSSAANIVHIAIIDVDVADDQPPLQLVVQTDDDPAALARRFGHEHDLPEESYAVLKSSFVVP